MIFEDNIQIGDIRMFNGRKQVEIVAIVGINDNGENLYSFRFIETGEIYKGRQGRGVHAHWIEYLVTPGIYEVCE